MRCGCHEEHGIVPSSGKHDERGLASELAVVLYVHGLTCFFHAYYFNDAAVQIVPCSAQHRHAANVNRSSV